MFDKRKKDTLAKKDKSKKGGVDKDIKQLVDTINSLSDYYTTSSCSGRIMLIEKKTNRKDLAKWLYVTHGKGVFKKLLQSLDPVPKDYVWFKQESVIIHVACRSIEDASKFLKIARTSGFKRAGIISTGQRVITEIIGTENIETIVSKDNELVVDKDYLKILLKEANKKMELNKKKIDSFLTLLKKSF